MFNSFAAKFAQIPQTILETLKMSSSSSAATQLDLESKSFRELQGLCRKRNLPVKGNTQALKQRLLEYEKSTKAKRLAPKKDKGTEFKSPPKKKPKPSPADDLICPITTELPVEPVVAEDGRTYEKKAILEYFSSRLASVEVRSPITGLKMGKRLVPNVQAKNYIETLIERGDIPDELANVWTQKIQVRDLAKKAESGNVQAMLVLADLYYTGRKVGEIDKEQACHWYKLAADAGNLFGMVNAAGILVTKFDSKSRASGLALMGMAAHESGSSCACIHLGTWFARGDLNLPVDKVQAIRLLEMGVTGKTSQNDVAAPVLNEARALLQALKKKK